MERTPKEHLDWFLSLPENQRGRFLAQFAVGLTIASRVFFHSSNATTDIARAREVNELLHKVSQYVFHILNGDENVEWAAAVILGPFESHDPLVRVQVQHAWDHAERTIC